MIDFTFYPKFRSKLQIFSQLSTFYYLYIVNFFNHIVKITTFAKIKFFIWHRNHQFPKEHATSGR